MRTYFDALCSLHLSRLPRSTREAIRSNHAESILDGISIHDIGCRFEELDSGEIRQIWTAMVQFLWETSSSLVIAQDVSLKNTFPKEERNNLVYEGYAEDKSLMRLV